MISQFAQLVLYNLEYFQVHKYKAIKIKFFFPLSLDSGFDTLTAERDRVSMGDSCFAGCQLVQTNLTPSAIASVTGWDFILEALSVANI